MALDIDRPRARPARRRRRRTSSIHRRPGPRRRCAGRGLLDALRRRAHRHARRDLAGRPRAREALACARSDALRARGRRRGRRGATLHRAHATARSGRGASRSRPCSAVGRVHHELIARRAAARRDVVVRDGRCLRRPPPRHADRLRRVGGPPLAAAGARRRARRHPRRRGPRRPTRRAAQRRRRARERPAQGARKMGISTLALPRRPDLRDVGLERRWSTLLPRHAGVWAGRPDADAIERRRRRRHRHACARRAAALPDPGLRPLPRTGEPHAFAPPS